MELSFGEQVKIILKRKNMTIKQLAESIERTTGMKMSRQNLTQRLTRDNFQEKDMRMIAAVLGYTVKLSVVEGTAEDAEIEETPRAEAKAVDIQEAVDHQMTIEEVVKAAGEESLLKEAEDKAISQVEQKVREEAESKSAAAATGSAEPKKRVTVRDLANKAREDRLLRERRLLEEARKRAEESEKEERRLADLRAAEEERLRKIREAEEAKRAEAEAIYQKRLAEQKARKQEQERLDALTPKERAAKEAEDAKEQERVREIARRALAAAKNNKAETSAAVNKEEVKEEKMVVPEETREKKEPISAAEDDENAKTAPAENTEEPVEEAKETVEEQQPATEAVGDINPRTGEEYESNMVRNHPRLMGYIQVYDRSEHKWIDMTEWAFLGFQERKKVLLGSEYEPPVYLD